MPLNRLAESRSLYLQKHATNPIQWWPWCEEALALAKERDRPIFLSVGYSSCHWCTVMEGEAFSDEAIAAYLNEHFVPIKVDREERPDIDSIYMQSLQAMTGQGGWPMNVFISPEDGISFYGGTYFPMDARYGRPGFLQVLQAVDNFYHSQKEKLISQKQALLDHLSESANISTSSSLRTDVLKKGLEASTLIVNNQTPGPNFPMMPHAFASLQSVYKLDQAEWSPLEVARKRGMDLVLGGIYDHVGGGFHRYTVDPTWTVPHFEKMLYDNGQILEYLANLWSAGIRDEAIERAIAGTISWLKREMTHDLGFFYAAQDADNFATKTDAEPEEGEFYVWRYQALQEALTEAELQALEDAFLITPSGNFEGSTVLQRRSGNALSDTCEAALEKLFVLRYGQPSDALLRFSPARNNDEAKGNDWPGRIPPVTDTKMIVAWNSLMISGLARAAVALQQPEAFQPAVECAQFIADRQWHDAKLYRLNYEGVATVDGQSEDYAFLIKAYLDLHQASLIFAQDNAAHWLNLAIAAQTAFDRQLGCPSGGFYNTGSENDALLKIRERSWQDNATPSANGVAIANLVRLAGLTDSQTWMERAETSLKSFSTVMADQPQMCPSLFSALDWFFKGITMKLSSGCLSEVLVDHYWPTVVAAIADQEIPANAVGLVCHQQACQAPSETVENLRATALELLV